MKPEVATPLIADASFICKLYFDEGEESAVAKTLLKRRAKDLRAPDLLLVEVGNSVFRRVRDREISRAEGEGFVADLRERFRRTIPASELFDAAWKMSMELLHPVADCVYLALAVQEGGAVATADRKFLRKLKDSRWEKFAIHIRDLV